MLITCPECQLQVSDKALTCPHCGNPMVKTEYISEKKSPRKKSRMRLPNGFGRITEMKGHNLRKPFRAMVTIGKDEHGRPIGKTLRPEGYFKTYNEAYQALLEYNRSPYDLEDDVTVSQLYARWSAEYFPTLKSDSSIRTVTSAWKYCGSIAGMRAKDVRARHLKACIDEGTAEINGEIRKPSAGVKSRIKSLFNMLFDYALEYEIVDKNYARTFELSGDIIKETEDNKRGHIAFTDDEMNALWENLGTLEYVNVILLQCYSGWRPQELVLLEVKNINLESLTMRGGMKTDAGYNRYVPIHPRVYPIVKKLYDEAVANGSKYLIQCNDTITHRGNEAMTYEKYRVRFNHVRDALQLNPDHRPHDPRKQFITMCKAAKVDEYAIKYMVGHAINDITEKIYTARKPEWFYEEICKIP